MVGKSGDQMGLFDQGYGSIPPEDCYQGGNGRSDNDRSGSDRSGNERPSRKEILDELHEGMRTLVGEVQTRVKLSAHHGGWMVQVRATVAGCEDYRFMGKMIVEAQGDADPEKVPSYTRHLVALQAVDRLVGRSGRSHGLKLGAVEGGVSWHEGETVYSWKVHSSRAYGGVALLCRGGGAEEAWELVPLA